MDVPVGQDWALEKFQRILQFYNLRSSVKEIKEVNIFGRQDDMVEGHEVYVTGWEQEIEPEDDWADSFDEGYLKVAFMPSGVWFSDLKLGSFVNNKVDYYQGPYAFLVAMIDCVRHFFMPFIGHHLPRMSHEWMKAELTC
jgi:hypothetical protein